jgi:Smg protein
LVIFVRYIGDMFEVLVFVYENYYTGETCPEPAHLERKLSAVGFESDEIDDAMTWLKGLDSAAHPAPPQPWLLQPHASSVRIYTAAEQTHLGVPCRGFISFLESAGVLPAHMREVIIDRAMAAPGAPVSLDDLKIIILMVYWRFGEEPDALVLDELCDDGAARVAH